MELIAIISVGIGLAGLILTGQHGLRLELLSQRIEMQTFRTEMQARLQAVRAGVQILREEIEAGFEKQRFLIMQPGERVARLEGLLTGSIVGRAEREAVLRQIPAPASSQASGRVEGVAEEAGQQRRAPQDKQD